VRIHRKLGRINRAVQLADAAAAQLLLSRMLVTACASSRERRRTRDPSAIRVSTCF
jgi:hypothetical protein